MDSTENEDLLLEILKQNYSKFIQTLHESEEPLELDDSIIKFMVGNETDLDPSMCSVITSYENWVLETLQFWMEGVFLVILASIGLVTNLGSFIILGTHAMHNSFNFLLMALGAFDTGYLLGAILEAVRKSFKVVTAVHMRIFPQFLYPGQVIMMSASIFVTVALAKERYDAIHQPVLYNQAMNNVRASLKRMLWYVIPSFIFSVLFNIPKFFEARVIEYTYNGTIYFDLGVTELRENTHYSTYYTVWARLIVLSIIPLGLVCWYNLKIFQDLKFRRQRNREWAHQSTRNMNGSKPGPTGAAPPKKIEGGEESSEASKPLATRHHRHNSHLLLNRIGNKGITVRDARPKEQPSGTSNSRNLEDQLAQVFFGIVLVFLLCHSLRAVLALHEMFTFSDTVNCNLIGRSSFPFWAMVTNQVSHFLLVINSSVNIVIYCALSPRLRDMFYARFRAWGIMPQRQAPVPPQVLPLKELNKPESPKMVEMKTKEDDVDEKDDKDENDKVSDEVALQIEAAGENDIVVLEVKSVQISAAKLEGSTRCQSV